MRVIDLRGRADLDVPRPDPGPAPLREVRSIIEQVRAEGDRALIALTERFDGVRLQPGTLRLPEAEMERAWEAASPALRAALDEAASRIRKVAEQQALRPWRAEVAGGVVGEDVHPVARAGVYVPSGRASYPSTVLMCAVPAAVAGVEEVALCVPPARDGTVPASTLAAARLAGVREIYRVGGAQAIAALAYGCESIRRVDVIAGPGNVYVALAKREVAGSVGIDSVAGPSEIAVVADRTADPRVLALDLIAQAEHGPHGSFLLITWEEELTLRVDEALSEALASAGASDELRAALQEGAAAVLVAGVDEAIGALNRFAPEHAELIFEGAEAAVGRVRAAGAVFIGRDSPVSLGDYLAGTNHVLPTGGAARWASGLRTSHFQRTSAVIMHTRDSLAGSLAGLRTLAGAEGLPNHARAVEARLGSPGSDAAANAAGSGDDKERR